MKFKVEYQELNLYPTFEKLPQKCTKKKVERKSCQGHKPTNLSLRVQPQRLEILLILPMTTDQEKGDLGVITTENQVTPRTSIGKSMENQQIESCHVLKMIKKVEDTVSALKTTQHHLIPIHSEKSNWNYCKNCSTNPNRGQIPPTL